MLGSEEPVVSNPPFGMLRPAAFSSGAEELGRAPVHRERALDGLVAEQVGLDRGLLLTGQRAGGHLGEGVAALGLEHRGGTVVAGLDVARARGGDEDGDVAAARHEGEDLLAHLLAGDVQRLPHVGQPVRADDRLAVLERAVRVIGKDRNARVHGILDRALERVRVDDGHGNSVRFGGDGRADVGRHLGDGGGLRAAPLRGGQTEQRGRVGQAVLGGREELVRGDVINEPELPLRTCSGNCRPPALVEPALLVEDEEQAEISADAAAVALNSPAPLSSLRRAGPSFILRVSMASSTTGSTLSFIWTSVELSRDTRCPEPDPLGKQHQCISAAGVAQIRGRFGDNPKARRNRRR